MLHITDSEKNDDHIARIGEDLSSSRCIELADPFSPDAIVTARISSKSRQKGEEISITPRAFPKVTMSLPMNLTTTERSRIGDS